MVYCGKPSRGCQMCRQRRIKCDEGKPTCAQCQKSRRVCPGYKDDFDLVFRNETQATERRARKAGNGKRVSLQIQKSHQRIASDGSADIMDVVMAPRSGHNTMSSYSIQNALTVPLATRASNFFLSNFVATPRPGTNRAWLDYIIPLIKSEPESSPLISAFNAVSMASLGNRPNARQLLMDANEQYTKALRQVNNALRDPATQKTDGTLASVLLLGLFEIITSKRTSVTAWGSHIDGAVMLVKMRGRKQLRTKIGQSLFHAIRTQMITNCQATSKHLEPGVEWWLKDAVKDEYSHKVTRLHLEVTELRAEINELLATLPRTPANTQKVLTVMNRAHDFDKSYAEFVQTVPGEWKYETVSWHDQAPGVDISDDEVCPGKIDLYSDIFIVTVWNNLRVTRVLLGGLIVRCAAWLCHPVDYRTTPEYASASRIGAEMITDICASIPFSLGWKLASGDNSVDVGIHAQYVCGDDGHDNSKGLGGYMAIWPLFTVSCSDFATDAQRKWVVGRLKYIADVMGIDQAKTFTHYQLRLPSMVVKRDALGAISQSHKSPSISSIATSLRHSSSPSMKTPMQSSTFSSSPASVSPNSGINQISPAVSTSIRTFSRDDDKAAIARKTILRDQSLTPPYSDGSTDYFAASQFDTNSQKTFVAANHGSSQSRTVYNKSFQPDFTSTYEQGSYRYSYPNPINSIPQNFHYHLPSSNSPQYTPINALPVLSTSEDRAQDKTAYAQMEADRLERELMAQETDRLQREETLEREKAELVTAAAGREPTKDMMKLIGEYLAVDVVKLTS